MATTIAPTTAPKAKPKVRNKLDEDDQSRAWWELAIGYLIVAACVAIVFYIINPGFAIFRPHGFKFGFIPWDWHGAKGDIFLNTTANGGDMGAHVWWPKFLGDNWLPKGRLSGWAPDWYAGFPVGQYYFPVPAILVWVLNVVLPYNVAFKVVTILGPMLLPIAAFYFARGMRTPWPAPPLFAVAALGTLVQTRNEWQIYGGNIASTLAGEFSFTIGLAFALFALGALAKTLDTGRKPWLPAALMALAVMSHIVVGIFMGLAAILLWLTRRPFRTWRLAVPVGFTAAALTAVWTLPLAATEHYTQSMRYTKLQVRGSGWKLPSFLEFGPLGPVKHTIEGLVNGLEAPAIDPNTNPARHFSPTLWLPGWIWLLVAIAVVAGAWYRRRSTGVLLLLGLVFGIMFVQWPEKAIWNTRFLPFWILSWAFVAAMGGTELLRLGSKLVQWSYRWIRDGDLQDARARAWAEVATAPADDTTVSEETRKDAAWALAERRFDRGPDGWEPPARLSAENIARRGRMIGAGALAVLLALSGMFLVTRAWDARDNNPGIAISGWAAWNYAGYERKGAYPQYKAIMDGVSEIANTPGVGPGRVLWEPSSGNPDAINSYGTSLALELMPHFTDGKIGSMEGIYFESSATTSFHFLMVSNCAQHPSNPVRALVYGNPNDDFDLCVKQMQDLGVRYYMVWTKEQRELADKNDDLTFVKEIPGEVQGTDLKGWRIYEVADSDLVEGMKTEPIVADVHPGKYSECWGQPWPDPNIREALLEQGWECDMAPAWMNRDLIDVPFVEGPPPGLRAQGEKVMTGGPKDPPKEWQRIDGRELDQADPRAIDDPAKVSNVKRDVDSIEFDVDQIGKPVVVKESFFPNWKVEGAKGPYRMSPNVMVVVPTSQHVKLSYGLTTADWLGRLITIFGLVGLVLLFVWKGAVRYGAGTEDAPVGDQPDENGGRDAADDSGDDSPEGDSPDGDDGDDPDQSGDPPDGEPPDRWEPAPALP
jgi:hypothetical protein